MDTREIRKRNVEIKLYMGYYWEGDLLVSPSGASHAVLAYLDYLPDWNDLMEVVEKIEKGNYGVKQCRRVVEIYLDDTKEVVTMAKEKTKRESLFVAITQFISLDNNQNKQQ